MANNIHTNREYISKLIADPNYIDDGYASYEALVHYHIKCPYHMGDDRAHCYRKDDDFICRDNCYYCKEEWLNSEVDT